MFTSLAQRAKVSFPFLEDNVSRNTKRVTEIVFHVGCTLQCVVFDLYNLPEGRKSSYSCSSVIFLILVGVFK